MHAHAQLTFLILRVFILFYKPLICFLQIHPKSITQVAVRSFTHYKYREHFFFFFFFQLLKISKFSIVFFFCGISAFIIISNKCFARTSIIAMINFSRFFFFYLFGRNSTTSDSIIQDVTQTLDLFFFFIFKQ